MSRSADVLRLSIRTLGELSITLGVLVLLFVVWQLWWTDVTADREQGRITQSLLREWDTPVPATVDPSASPSSPSSPAPVAPIELGDAFAILRIPTLSADYAVPVLAGTSSAVLKKGVGHYKDTAGPGEVGNFAMAGHRTTYGAPLNGIAKLKESDPIVVETATTYYVYRVDAIEIVAPTDVAVIAPVPDEPTATPTQKRITLTSCHPMFSARQRYIVHGTLETESPRQAGPPAVLAAG